MSGSRRPPAASEPLRPWTVERSRYALHDRWLKVRADDCITSDGAPVAPYYVLEYPDWVHVVALDQHDNLILVEQYRHGLGGMSLELPAGAIDPTDAGPLDAAARELREETGFASCDLQHLLVLSPNPATHSNRFHVVLARGAELRHAPTDDPTERLNVVRVALKDVTPLIIGGKMLHSMHIASLWVALGMLKDAKGEP